MKLIGIILWILVVVWVWFGIYKASNIFTFQEAFETVSSPEKVEVKMNDVKKYGEWLVESGKQYVLSGAEALTASWKAILDEQKKKAEAYLLEQKELLKKEAQKQLEAEAKKRIEALFTGK